MSTDSERKPVPVSLPPELVEELDRLVEEGIFTSRSDALRYGARLVVREERERRRLHERADDRAASDIARRIERKRQSQMYLDTDVILAELKVDDWLTSEVELDAVEEPIAEEPVFDPAPEDAESIDDLLDSQ